MYMYIYVQIRLIHTYQYVCVEVCTWNPGRSNLNFQIITSSSQIQAHQLHADLRNHAEIWAARAMQSLRISLSSVVFLLMALSLSLCSLFLSVCLPHLEVAHWPSLRHPCMCECTCELQGAKCSITYHETFRKISQMQMCKAQVICFLALCARPSNLYCTL